MPHFYLSHSCSPLTTVEGKGEEEEAKFTFLCVVFPVTYRKLLLGTATDTKLILNVLITDEETDFRTEIRITLKRKITVRHM